MDGLVTTMTALAVAGPAIMCLAAVVLVACLFGCYKCYYCRIRNCRCIKRCMRCCGCDPFDDFEVMILVHEAYFDQKLENVKTSVRVTAAAHKIATDPSSKSCYQQPLSVFVEQGTDKIAVDLLDYRDKIVATLLLDPQKDLLNINAKGNAEQLVEKMYVMKNKGKDVSNPKIKLSIVFDGEGEVETGLLSGLNLSSTAEWQIKQQIKKTGGVKKGQSETQMLAQACAGSLDMFQGIGNAETCYVAVVGPPAQKKYTFGVWANHSAFERKSSPEEEVDLLKVKSIQGDPARSNVFTVNYFDSNRVVQQLAFRRIDRSREVWMEMLQLLIKKVHAEAKDKKDKKAGKA